MSSSIPATEKHVSWRVRGLWLGLALASSLGSDALVFLGRPGPAAIACWAISLLLLVGAFHDDVLSGLRLLGPTWKRAGLLLLFFLPVLVRVLNTDTCRVHGDELMTAFFSAMEDIGPARFFAEVPENAGQWVCQFPTAFFLLQRLFFHVFGDSLAMVRWSVLPYVFLAGAFLYLSARRVAGAFTGVISVVLYSFLAVSLYLETVGLHFVSSTAMLVVFFFFALRALQDDRDVDAVLAGVTCGFCYLFYTSSYVAAPILAAVLALRVWRRRRLDPWRTLALPAIGFAVALGPFLTHALKIHNYFMGRIEQVSLLNGQWSNAAERMAKGEGALTIVGKNLAVALKAFWTSGIGGQGGYWYAHLPLLNHGTLVLFLIGLGVALFRMRRRAEFGLVVLVILTSFVTGVVLTIPPPAYHRLAAAFPFFALVMALPFREVWNFERLSRIARAALVAGGLALFTTGNLNTFTISALPEYSTVELLFASWINRRYPDRQLYIAAFPANAYEKIAYFATPRRKGTIIEDYHDPLLRELNTEEKYIYVVLFADEFKARFQKVDPKGHFKVFAPGWGIFVN